MATVPGIPMVSAFGESAEEALAELQAALEACAEAAKENGIKFPPLEVKSLRRASALLNMSELSRRLGVRNTTLASKISRGSKLKEEEAQAINEALHESGLALISSD